MSNLDNQISDKRIRVNALAAIIVLWPTLNFVDSSISITTLV
jgi:hypothetical protein